MGDTVFFISIHMIPILSDLTKSSFTPINVMLLIRASKRI